MNHNHNNILNNKTNKYVKKLLDLSNNRVYLSNDDSLLPIRKYYPLHGSKYNKLPKLIDDNIIYNETNIKQRFNANIMNTSNKLITPNKVITPNKLTTPNKVITPSNLITHLDNTYYLNDKINKETDLLKNFLKQTEHDFAKYYDSPFFSGSPQSVPYLNEIPPSICQLPSIEEEIIKEHILIDASIDNLIDLIDLCDKYPMHDNVEYNINMKAIHNIKPSLVELQDMIGMSSIKENIVDQILYFVQDLHNVSPNNSDYMHAVICGPPGTGKTEVAKIMGKIFSNLGILKKNVFKKVTREDLVAGYLGQTAIKTKDVIKECVGGVLFIDEAYALGNSEKKDSFSKECIDTICEALSDHKDDLMCIIAGYEQELKDCFFSYNTGLESRFTWKFKIDDYSPSELRQIFEKKIKDSGWGLKDSLSDEWFEKNKDCFSFFGRDMETLFSKVKIAHSRRVFCLSKEEKTFINNKDLQKGFDIFLQMGESKKRKEDKERTSQLYNTLYC